jgi:hypothetical protein
MRRTDAQQETLYNMVFPEQRVPTGHPLGPIREMVNAALKQLDEDLNRGDPGPRPYAGPAPTVIAHVIDWSKPLEFPLNIPGNSLHRVTKCAMNCNHKYILDEITSPDTEAVLFRTFADHQMIARRVSNFTNVRTEINDLAFG